MPVACSRKGKYPSYIQLFSSILYYEAHGMRKTSIYWIIKLSSFLLFLLEDITTYVHLYFTLLLAHTNMATGRVHLIEYKFHTMPLVFITPQTFHGIQGTVTILRFK